jgi:hypothetical protein
VSATSATCRRQGSGLGSVMSPLIETRRHRAGAS